MTSAAGADDGRPGRDWQEVLLTALLVLAALGTSWSSYQAARWNAEQAAAASRTGAIRVEAARAEGLSEAQTQVDVATFIAWSDARGTGEPELARYYVERFRDEFRPAFRAWLASRPFSAPVAPGTPFVMPEYEVAAGQEAESLDADAEASSAQQREYLQRASNYVLSVVLYAVALFFGGIGTRVGDRRLRWVLLGAGTAALAGALVWVATSPVSVQV